jgi:3',5'-cyclic AMP phosphodiesterase CpdA
VTATPDKAASPARPRLTIAHISDLHAGSPYFVPSLMDRTVIELNELRPDLVLCTGDLTEMGFRQDYVAAREYLSRIECPELVVIPGNHDARNVGYVHFEEFFGPRSRSLRREDVTIVAVDSSEPDLDVGQIGRARYDWLLDEFAAPARFRIFMLHHHLLPIPGTGRERNMVHDAGDVLEVLQECGVNLVLSGHKHVPYAWRLEEMFIVNTGTVSSLRLRGNTRPCYNVVEISGTHVDIWRHHPFHGQERIIQFSTETLQYEKYTGRIEREVTTRR